MVSWPSFGPCTPPSNVQGASAPSTSMKSHRRLLLRSSCGSATCRNTPLTNNNSFFDEFEHVASSFGSGNIAAITRAGNNRALIAGVTMKLRHSKTPVRDDEKVHRFKKKKRTHAVLAYRTQSDWAALQNDKHGYHCKAAGAQQRLNAWRGLQASAGDQPYRVNGVVAEPALRPWGSWHGSMLLSDHLHQHR